MLQKRELVLISLGLVLILYLSLIVLGAPVGPNVITYLENKTRGQNAAVPRGQDERGTITVVRMNVTQQSLYWKAYVGNVTGKITLDDDMNYTIYDWTLSATSGEVYATRKTTPVSWTSVACATNDDLEAEAALLNHTLDKSDNLNKTFASNGHPSFWAGSVDFTKDECRHTIHSYVNDVPNSATFSEIILNETGGNLVYVSILNNSARGYDNGYYDFQMLVAEKGQDGDLITPLTYYFYVELT